MYSAPEPFKFTTKWDFVGNDPQHSDLICLIWFSISSYCIIGSKDKSSYWYWSFVCSDTEITGSNFWTLSSFKHIALIFTDYYILENNSLLKAALKYKRIQLTDFRTVPMEHFGEKVFVSLLLLSVTEQLVLYCRYICFSLISFLQIYLWRYPTHQTSLIPVIMDYCCWCMYHVWWHIRHCRIYQNCILIN